MNYSRRISHRFLVNSRSFILVLAVFWGSPYHRGFVEGGFVLFLPAPQAFQRRSYSETLKASSLSPRRDVFCSSHSNRNSAIIGEENPAAPQTQVAPQSSIPSSGVSSSDNTTGNVDSKVSIFELLALRTMQCLIRSDMRRDAIGKKVGTQASSSSNWIDEETAFALQQTLDKVQLVHPDSLSGLERDEANSWIRWMKTAPSSVVIDLSSNLRDIVNQTLCDKDLERIDQRRDVFLARIQCRMIVMPSGAEIPNPFVEAPSSLIFAKLLYGGVSRYRILSNSSNRKAPPRKAGERTVIKSMEDQSVPLWIMYGGPLRKYKAVDMGPAGLLEICLLPRKTIQYIPSKNMAIDVFAWNPSTMLDFRWNGSKGEGEIVANGRSHSLAVSLHGNARNEAFRTEFQSRVGGLQPQIDAIVRRVLDGRIIRPADEDDEATAMASSATLEAKELELLGLSPVRGLLLYGPPGCGKTALAREISAALRAREPKIVSAPELLDRWVGGSEKLVRSLFTDAEAELASCNGDPSKSALHVIVIDEIDAVFRTRTTAEDSGESTRSSVVNQILAKLDGVNAIPNVLVIGMTNRRELLDEALLRPGRLEVQIEIPLPDREARREILQIHFGPLRDKGRLSQPLCEAIDGTQYVPKSESRSKRKRARTLVKLALKKITGLRAGARNFDLAACTVGFSGADIAGLVRSAGSLALQRARSDGSGIDGLKITLEDVKAALREVKV